MSITRSTLLCGPLARSSQWKDKVFFVVHLACHGYYNQSLFLNGHYDRSYNSLQTFEQLRARNNRSLCVVFISHKWRSIAHFHLF